MVRTNVRSQMYSLAVNQNRSRFRHVPDYMSCQMWIHVNEPVIQKPCRQIAKMIHDPSVLQAFEVVVTTAMHHHVMDQFRYRGNTRAIECRNSQRLTGIRVKQDFMLDSDIITGRTIKEEMPNIINICWTATKTGTWLERYPLWSKSAFLYPWIMRAES